MSDNQDNDPSANALTITPEHELEALKKRATLMNISFHPTIGLDKLREKVNAAIFAAQQGQSQPPADPVAPAVDPADPLPPVEIEETLAQKRKRIRNECMKLIRVRIVCMNPAKREWHGEMFTVGNSLVGSVTRFVPFSAEDGWHVPQIMLNMLRDRQCQIFVNRKTQNGVTMREGKLIREFNIEILPPLTGDEIKDLAQRQAMAGTIG
jgi:hypothetical protein